MTNKRKFQRIGEQPNLKQFRTEIQSLMKNDRSENHSGLTGKQSLPKQSRKERRKEARLEKKSRKNAYHRNLPIPTKEDKEREKRLEEMKIREERKKKKLKLEKKKQKKLKARQKKQAEESKEEQQQIASMWDDKEIKSLEKKLGLDKRKKKDTLPQSFHNDGLDYILDVTNSEKLQAMAELNQEDNELEAGESDMEGDDFGMMGDDDDDDEDDEDHVPADFDDVDSDDDDDDESDEDHVPADFDDVDSDDDDDDESDDDEEDIKVSKKSRTSNNLENDKTRLKDKSSESVDIANKKEKWEELADKIREITEKKKREKENKSKKKVTFSEDLEEEEIEKESDDAESEGFDGDGDIIDDGDDDSDEGGLSDLGDDICSDDGKKGFGSDFDDNAEEELDTESPNTLKKKKTESSTVGDLRESMCELKEDIYGRLRDTEGNIVVDNKPAGGEGQGAYVPPARQLQMAGTVDEKQKIKLERLQKQLKGLVNRASEANMQSISSQIEELYLSNSRADVNESLVQLVSSACITPVLTPERLSMELMMLVAILHGNVGSEVGAVFLQQFAKQFDTLHQLPDCGSGKQIDNVVILLAHLYNFKVVHSVLIFDLLKVICDGFTEKDIELILLLLRNVGFTLRKDNAHELKEFILHVQAQASSEDGKRLADQSRVRFMLDIVMAIRNNNMRKIPNYDTEHLEHLRKLIKSFIRGGHFGDNQLHIGLGDLLQAEEQGKWWLVGSAWAGKEDRSELGPEKSQTTSVVGSLEVSSKLQQLARKQRMNTELRRNIFFVIMTSEDYLDAFEKLLRLGLKSSQQQEIVVVIIDCCLQEKKYNPFYAHLSQKFCEHHRTFQMGYQFSIWDRFKEISELSDARRSNFAKLLTHLFASKALSLSILKVIQFGTLEKSMVRLIKQVMSELLLNHPEPTIEAAFSRIAQFDKLKQLHEGLRLFLRHFLLGGKKTEKNPLMVERVDMVDRILSRGKSHVLL